MGAVLPLNDDTFGHASLAPLMELVDADMKRVNDLIVSRVGSDVPMIREIAKHLIGSGGKRLRPMLTIAAARMFGYDGDNHINLAASVEFMHSATLLHDDVVDESDMRRGKPAAHMVWGNQASVLVGDFLLGQAFKMMVEVGILDALEVLSGAAAVIAEGEVMQLVVAHKLATTEDEYLAVIKAKTAALFSAAAEVGPIIAGKGQPEREALRSYGVNLGAAFQLIDDALDYSGKSGDLGKNIGDDFREGKMTLPVILAYRRGSDDERSFWKQAMQNPQGAEDFLKQAITYIDQHDAITDTITKARYYGTIAREALTSLPDGMEKAALMEAVDFCISRAY